jgi:hypothetical protein
MGSGMKPSRFHISEESASSEALFRSTLDVRGCRVLNLFKKNKSNRELAEDQLTGSYRWMTEFIGRMLRSVERNVDEERSRRNKCEKVSYGIIIKKGASK